MNIIVHFKDDSPTIQSLIEELLLEYYRINEMEG